MFISYARPDAHIAQALAAQLNAIGVDYWIDYANLAIGKDWLQAITAGLKGADGVIIFSSARSSQSDWVMREIRFAGANNVPLLPVVVDNYANLPSDLAHIQAVLIRTDSLEESVGDAARAIQNSLARKPASKVDEAFSSVFAQDLAKEVSKAGQSTTEDAKHSVFVVHGHDNDALKLVRTIFSRSG